MSSYFISIMFIEAYAKSVNVFYVGYPFPLGALAEKTGTTLLGSTFWGAGAARLSKKYLQS